MPQIQNMTSHPKWLGWLVHSIVCSVIFFQFLFRGRGLETFNLHDWLRILVLMAGALAVFYANYLYLVKRFLFTRQILIYLFINLLLFAVVIVVSQLFNNLIPTPEVAYPRHVRAGAVYFSILFEIVKYVYLTALSVALKATSSWYKMDTERKELEKQRSEAELQNLKNQLNPHFLFNTLNNIYSLIAINGEQAQNAVHELSRLLRYMLYESAQTFVPVGKDIEFVQNYVKLMQIRMPSHVELKTEIRVEQPDVLIAPLLFISPVENAFKHGVSSSKPSFIHIEIIATGKQIKCLIRNSFFPKDKHDKSGSGIGLVNLRKRLDLLYPGNYELTCKQTVETYSCELSIYLSENQ